MAIFLHILLSFKRKFPQLSLTLLIPFAFSHILRVKDSLSLCPSPPFSDPLARAGDFLFTAILNVPMYPDLSFFLPLIGSVCHGLSLAAVVSHLDFLLLFNLFSIYYPEGSFKKKSDHKNTFFQN